MTEIRCIKVRVRICVEPDGEGYYAYSPELKGVHEGGKTIETAVENAKKSAIVYIESILRHNDPLSLCAEEDLVSLESLSISEIKPKLPKKDLITQFEDLELSFA